MKINTPYKVITREQFLFHEMRVVAQLKCDGKTDEEIIEMIVNGNMFQYPTERMIKTLANVCIKRINALGDYNLVDTIANGSLVGAKQVCLYAMMNYYRIIHDFMITVIAEKLRTKDYNFSKRDILVFFSRLQEQNATVASWSDTTISKIRQVIMKMLVDNEYLDSTKSEILNTVLIDEQLKQYLLDKKDYVSLEAFNYFEKVEI